VEIVVGLLAIFLVAAFLMIFSLRSSVSELEERVSTLIRRVWDLEHPVVRPQTVEKVAPVVAPALAPIPPPIPVAARMAVPPVAPPPRPVPEPSISDRLRETVGDEGWEALVGGSVLNKVGALVLVVGIALFLAYSFAHMGSVGRAGTSLIVSLALLGSGVWVERKELYRVFARGLIGAGWAALYATAYAIYAIPDARVIESPFWGSCLLLVVAAGMVVHSLGYRSQSVTAIAFFCAFAALAVGPSTPFAVLSLIPLAAALLYLAQRFNWHAMALMGIAATYGTCISRGSTDASLAATESLFIAYWVLFELFDLLRFSRRLGGWALELIFPLNSAGFLALTYNAWTRKSPENVWMMSAGMALLYLVSALWRLRVEMARPAEPEDVAARIRAGCFEAPLTVAAFVAAAAIVQKLTGSWQSTALAMEAEALFLAGIRLRTRWLRGLAALGFAYSVAMLSGSGPVWIYNGLFHALLFYTNRALSRAGSISGEVYSWAGSLMVGLVLAWKLPEHLVGPGLLIFAGVLFVFGVSKKLTEFRRQAYLISWTGVAAAMLLCGRGTEHPSIALAVGLAVAYAGAWRTSLLEKTEEDSIEWRSAAWGTAGVSAAFAVQLLYTVVPQSYSGAAIWGLAVVLLELGIRKLPAKLRVFSYPVAAMAALVVLVDDGLQLVKFAPQQVWLSFFASAAAAWVISLRSSGQLERHALGVTGTLFGMTALWIVVPDPFVPAAWAAFAWAILETGNVLQGAVVSGIAAVGAFWFTLPAGHPDRLIATLCLIAVHVGLRFRSTLRPDLHLWAASVLGAVLIDQEVSGSVLTLAWGALALALLGAGFTIRERPLRLQGLSLFLLCVLKLFVYDLRNLETPYRILSFVALGLILLGVSWVYTRFRTHVQKLF
jgi:uncharacterized membrane protein